MKENEQIKVFLICDPNYTKYYFSTIKINFNPRLPSGVKRKYPWEIILSLGDYPIVLAKAETKKGIIEKYKKILKKTNISFLRG